MSNLTTMLEKVESSEDFNQLSKVCKFDEIKKTLISSLKNQIYRQSYNTTKNELLKKARILYKEGKITL